MVGQCRTRISRVSVVIDIFRSNIFDINKKTTSLSASIGANFTKPKQWKGDESSPRNGSTRRTVIEQKLPPDSSLRWKDDLDWLNEPTVADCFDVAPKNMLNHVC